MAVARAQTPLLAYRPELDGLRAIAVLMVMVAHSGIQRGNGFLGVELFFVLSGYLITTLLLREHARTGTIDLRIFYAKRVLRLFPALLAVVAVMALYTLTLASDEVRDGLVTGIWTSALYVSNWFRAFGSDLEFLGHTWSLAIEEQFYLLWPPVLALLLGRRWDARRIAVLLGAIVVAVAVWRRFLHLDGADYQRLYGGLDTRLDALMLGALLAALLAIGTTTTSPRVRRRVHVGGWLSAAVMVAAMARDADGTIVTIHDGYSISAILCFGVVALVVVEPPAWMVRLLSIPLAVWIGVRSYGLYLWHFPVFKMLEDLKESLGHEAYGLLSWAVSFLVAAVSYRVIETPFLRWKSKLTAKARAAEPATNRP